MIFIIKIIKMEQKKTVIWWITFVLLCIWQLPQFLVGIVMMPFMGKKRLMADRHFNFCWEGNNMSGGISLGPISYVSKNLSKSEESISHEVDGHAVQSKILGPFYLFVIGIPSIVWAWLYDYKKHCYYDFYTEKNANFFAHLNVDKSCNLYFSNP